MIVIGIDPGLVNTGFAAVEQKGSRFAVLDFGVICPAAELPLERKLLEVFEKIDALCVKHKPLHAAVEEIFFSRNAGSALMVGQSRGAALLALARNGVRVFGYSPKEIKLALVGTGTAEKRQVSKMVSLLTGIREKQYTYDAYDAVAAAICHCNKYGSGVCYDSLS